MNIVQNKILLQRLAADYGLGTMQGAARRRFEALARRQAPVRQAIRDWQERLAGLTELQAAQPAPEVVWKRIEIALHFEREAARLSDARRQTRTAASPDATSLPWWRQLFVWQGVSAAALSLALLAWWQPWQAVNDGSTQARAPSGATQETLALLLDGENRPAWLASWSGGPAQGAAAGRVQLRLQDLSGQAVPAGRSLQLWAVPAQGAPRSLGVLGADEAGRVLTTASAQVQGAVVLALSLEVQGGVPEAGGPQGPILYKGPLVRKLI
ncbi:MAG: RNA polymerase subunit sigma-70 [Curvibacter sp.]|nr:MAG: RNA polymerase subunit sigma-70 [Curvibacter sp.]